MLQGLKASMKWILGKCQNKTKEEKIVWFLEEYEKRRKDREAIGEIYAGR